MEVKSNRAEREEKILQFWKENEIFEKTLEQKSSKGDFVFYEGPPTANGRPAIHHLEARAFKDAIPRYKTMQGYRVRRKGGWDTHGLPVELEVEKELGLKSKKDIEAYGVDKFNAACRRSVWKYVDEWQKFTDRIGFWVDTKKPYVTYENSYIQAVWSILAHVEKKDLLYKDYKVVPWCPRCGTALSSHELAQGYKDVKDLSVYVKLKIVGFDNAYFLAWTTTPWTLPGNVALAVGEDMDYVEAKVGDEILVLAKERLSVLEMEYEIIAEHKGKDMVGMKYEPLYPYIADDTGKAYQVYTAEFVTTEDGTGIVHTAVMYGQEDFELGTKIGLPKKHLVDESGHFLPEAGFLAGKFVKDEETAVDIIKDLAGRGLLFKKEKYEHSYPHCWRCGTPLIYYARDSWYIRMSELREKLLKENEKIHWEPEHIKDGRFGEWLKEVKDWAISRERYWGTPLPIWQSESGKRIVVDSLETIKKYSKTNGNNFIVMRHGHAENNELDVCNSDVSKEYHLTEEGRTKVLDSAKKLQKEKVQYIYHSPFLRTKETVNIVNNQLNLPDEKIIEDDRLREFGYGEWEGKNHTEYMNYMSNSNFAFTDALPGGESYALAKKRFSEFLYEIDNKHTNETILIVTHGIGTEILPMASEVLPAGALVGKMLTYGAQAGSYKEFSFTPLPHNADYEVDLHKPYIDAVVLEKDGEEYRRVKEVMDVWFDSGGMPFAQDADSREKPGDFSNIIYPADFISEGMDQTRGWFYTLHAIGALMDKGRAFENVICLGLINDKDGKKMSKSVGNVLDPWEEMDKYGVDTLRLWMYSVNQPGESKNYDIRTVDEVQKRIFNLIDNVLSFYELYRDTELEFGKVRVQNILDKWIMTRLDELVGLMTEKLDNYKLLEPTRALREFIDDLSTWYLRRSRDRIKEGDKEAKATLYHVLKTLSKLLAPLAPFAAEDLYQKLRLETDPISVHLEAWPKSGDVDEDLIGRMLKTREVVSLLLEARSKAGIKLRQPIGWVKAPLARVYIDLLKEELNTKEALDSETIEIDTELSPELIEEGKVREIIRNIQEMRKDKNLKPSDMMQYDVPDADRELFEKYVEKIKSATNIL